MKYLFILFLVACGPTYEPAVACIGATGVVIRAPVPAGWCESLRDIEARTLAAFREVVPADARFVKQDFSNWHVHVMTETGWLDRNGHVVFGTTDCPSFTICVGSQFPKDGAFAHEMAHAVQYCEPKGPWDMTDEQSFYHSNWAPIYKALDAHGLSP